MEIVHGSVYGYRAWGVYMHTNPELPALHPTGMMWHVSPKWSYGVTEAECLAPLEHTAPDYHCECGLYAKHYPPNILRRPITWRAQEVFGTVEMFGKVIYHDRGYRSQYARVHSLRRVNVCHFCFEKMDTYEERAGTKILLDDVGTYAGFSEPKWISSTIGGRYTYHLVQMLQVVLCESCKDEIVESGLIYKPPRYFAPMYLDSIKPMKPIFETLAKLYCDGRVDAK